MPRTTLPIQSHDHSLILKGIVVKSTKDTEKKYLFYLCDELLCWSAVWGRYLPARITTISTIVSYRQIATFLWC